MKSLLVKSRKQAKRFVIAAVGSTILLIGAAMIILPGPAVVVIPAGLMILATEFVWARRLLAKARGWLKNEAPGPVKNNGRKTAGRGTRIFEE